MNRYISIITSRTTAIPTVHYYVAADCSDRFLSREAFAKHMLEAISPADSSTCSDVTNSAAMHPRAWFPEIMSLSDTRKLSRVRDDDIVISVECF